MKYLLQTPFGRITVYLLTILMTFLPCATSSNITKVYASEDSYESTEKELEVLMEESKAAIGSGKKSTAPRYDEEPPTIMHAPIQTSGKQDVQIQATIEDSTGVKGATLHYRVKGNESFENVKMKKVEGSTYLGVIPEDKVSFAGMEYYIEASDSNDNIGTDGSKETVYAVLVEGAPVEKNMETAENPIYKKWWFWALAAAAAGGAAALSGGSGGGGGGSSDNSSGGTSGGSGGSSSSGGTGSVTGTW
jgi:hypothetical protein